MLFGAHQFCYRQHPWYVMTAGPDDSSCLRCFAETWSEDLSNALGWKPLIVRLRLWIFPVNDFFEVEVWKITLAGYLFTCVPDKPWHWTVHVQTMDWFTLHPPTMPMLQITLFLCHISISWGACFLYLCLIALWVNPSSSAEFLFEWKVCCVVCGADLKLQQFPPCYTWEIHWLKKTQPSWAVMVHAHF